MLPKSEKPRSVKRESAYFETGELGPLLSQLAAGVWQTVFRVALGTGMRQGELTALLWGDVDLTGKVIQVRRSYTTGVLSETKNRERRTVDLTDDVVEVLGAWWGECGKPGDDVLVFPDERTGGYLQPAAFTKQALYRR